MGRTWMMCDLILPTKTIDDKGDWLGFVQKWPLLQSAVWTFQLYMFSCM